MFYHLQLTLLPVIVMMLVRVELLILVRDEVGGKLLLVEREVHTFLRPRDDGVLHDVGLKLEHAGCQKLCLELLPEVIQFVHVITVARALVELADVDDKHWLGLLVDVALDLLSQVLHETVLLPNQTFLVLEEVAVFGIEGGQFGLDVAQVDLLNLLRIWISDQLSTIRLPFSHAFNQVDAGEHVVATLGVLGALEGLLVQLFGL